MTSLSSPFFGAMGCAAAIVFCCFGAAYGTAKSGVGIATMGVLRPELIIKNVIPVVMVFPLNLGWYYWYLRCRRRCVVERWL